MNRLSIKKKTITKMKTYIKRMMKKMKMSKGIKMPIYSKIKRMSRVRVNCKSI